MDTDILAGRMLQFERAPTLLIVGGAGTEVLALNFCAYDVIPGVRRLVIVPNAPISSKSLGQWRRSVASRLSGSSATLMHISIGKAADCLSRRPSSIGT
jgi:hypothetical protein